MRISPSPAAPAPDSEPGPAPSLPGGALWGESDVGIRPAADAPPPRSTDTADGNMPTIGHIGRYALKYKLGAGGLGTVYAAYDPLLSRLIAVKTLNVEIAAEQREAFNALFLNEARAAGGLSHPHIVTVFDAGISDDSAYIAMELLKGRDLRQLREEGWRPSPEQAALVVRRVADALAYAHSHGVVHRDVKPANIFMVGRTQPRVLDFGIASVAHRRDAGSGGDLVAGSPYYMAPEQIREEPVDRRADVFSLGVVLYELLTDQKPFRGSTLAEITGAVLNHEAPFADTIEPAVPTALAQITARAMAKDPAQRYRSARAFSRELRDWLEAKDQERDPPGGRPSRAMLPWLAAGAVAVAALGVTWLATASRHEVAAPAAPATADAAASAITATVAAPAPVMAATATVEPTVAATTADATAAASAALPAESGTAATPTTAIAATPAATTAASTASVAQPTLPPPAAAARPAPHPAAARESAKERRSRELREREARVAAVPAAPAAAVVANGVVRIAISPWGDIEVDGKHAGTAPPLHELTLPEGPHRIVIRNADFPPYSAAITVTPEQPVTIKHRFGS